MTEEVIQFLKDLSINGQKGKGIAISFIWYVSIKDHSKHVSMKEMCDLIESALNTRPNITKLRTALKSDKRTSYRKKDDSFSIKASARPELEDTLMDFVDSRPIPKSNSFLPHALFTQARRGYIVKTVDQINASYTYGLYDCCAVMCRRLLETLIIDVYEKRGETAKLKGGDGHFVSLSDLLKVLETDFNSHVLNIGRNSLKGLKDAKSVGDKAAHYRKWNAKKTDLDKIQNGVRDAAEELIHMAY